MISTFCTPDSRWSPRFYDRTLTVNGVSKAYAMTGLAYRLCCGAEKLIGAMRKVQSQSTSNPCTSAMAASRKR